MARNISALCLIIMIIVSCMGFGILTLAEPSADHIESAQVYDVETAEPPTVIPAKTVKPQKIKKKPAYFTDIKDGKITISSLKSICKYVGKRYDIDPELLQAIAFVESDYEVNYDGISGDKGLCQIVERFHTERMEKLNVTDLYDPYSVMCEYKNLKGDD